MAELSACHCMSVSRLKFLLKLPAVQYSFGSRTLAYLCGLGSVVE